jgi:transcriptional regulator of acetoin/glycerol metabolism
MPVALQAVLLRLLDDWTVRPVGGVRAKVDVFLVSATNASLDKAIAEGRFRSDLLYRLNTLEVTLPRLRDRSDFEAIIHHLLGAIDPNYEITPATIAHLAARPWPGNIRELRNMLARFTLANADGFIDEAGVEAMIDQAPLTTPGSLRHPAGSYPCGLCRNRWKHQRNCTASRCLEKYYTIERLDKKSRDDLQVRALPMYCCKIIIVRHRRPGLAQPMDRSRPAFWRSTSASSGSGRRRRPHCEPRCNRP